STRIADDRTAAGAVRNARRHADHLGAQLVKSSVLKGDVMSLRSVGVLICVLVAAAPAAAQQQPKIDDVKKAGDLIRKMADDNSKPVLGYSLVLLLGETESAPLPDGLSAPARKALADIKDFLPFKSYRILDTQWSAGSESGAVVSGRLRGLSETQLFTFKLNASRLNQHFLLWKDEATGGSSIILDATFTQHVGETVVVGTSKIQADKALIVLLTIVEGPRSGGGQ